jgi:hypothetical protein
VSDENLNIVCTALQCLFFTLRLEQWKIKINASKTKAINFIRYWAPRELLSTNISIDGHSVPWSTQVKYLDGVTLDNSLVFASHITAKFIEKSEKAFPHSLIIFEHQFETQFVLSYAMELNLIPLCQYLKEKASNNPKQVFKDNFEPPFEEFSDRIYSNVESPAIKYLVSNGSAVSFCFLLSLQ